MEKDTCQNNNYFRYRFIKNDIVCFAFALYLQKTPLF